jgi:hypothetical protein
MKELTIAGKTSSGLHPRPPVPGMVSGLHSSTPWSQFLRSTVSLNLPVDWDLEKKMRIHWE